MAQAPAQSRNVLRQRAEQLAATLPPLLVAAERVAATVAQGVHGRRRVGTGETFWQFRRYQPGDAAQNIDWRQSAKSQKLFVRENEWEAAQSVWLWRDGSASMRFRSNFADVEKIERADLLLLAIAALLVRGGERVALLGSDNPPSTGQVTLTRLAATLLRGQENHQGGGADLPRLARLPRHAQAVFIGDFLSPVSEIDSVVKAFAGEGVRGHLLQILDPAEEDLPYRGRTRFEGLQDDGDIVVGRAENLRADYIARLARRREDLLQSTRAVGWTCAFHRTDRPPQTALLALYSAMGSDPAAS